MTKDEDKVLHALNQYWGKGFAAAFGVIDVAAYQPRGRSAQRAAIEQFRAGREVGKCILALADS